MVEIFKTKLNSKKKANQVILILQHEFPNYKIDFDLDDCDRILRIDTFEEELNEDIILKIVSNFGFSIEVLADEIPFIKV